MPVIEGKGWEKPSPIEISVKPAERQEIYRKAKRITDFRGYNHRHDNWGKGFIPNAGGLGSMGEYALERFLKNRGIQCTVDMKLHTKGDGGIDFIIYGKRIQVKTSGGFYETQLVRRIDDRGNLVPLKADLVVFCCYPDGGTVYLLGWVGKVKLESILAKARRKGAKHWNNEYPTDHLEPMNRLVVYLQLAREKYVTN